MCWLNRPVLPIQVIDVAIFYYIFKKKHDDSLMLCSILKFIIIISLSTEQVSSRVPCWSQSAVEKQLHIRDPEKIIVMSFSLEQAE